MTRFRSKHYPHSGNSFVMLQQYAMQYYGGMMLLVVMAVMVRVASGQSVLWFALIGLFASMILGNLFAYVKLKKGYAEIFFLNEHFSLISVYDILSQQDSHVFPLKYANASRTENQISFHYHDQIITLKKEDWEDFELIWNWLAQNDRVM